MDSWILVSGFSLAFSLPGLLFSYYTLFLFISTLMYPRSLVDDRPIGDPLRVSILIATFNERYVIARSLDAIKLLDYPRDRLQVVIADDSTDDTVEIIDSKVEELNSLGILSVVSRRNDRTGFKSGALNNAAHLLSGDYALLLDADSTVKPDILTKGLNAFRHDPSIGFVSFRVGHYNREQSLTTRLFALQLDQGDTVSKMGAYAINAPYSFQGGFVLVSMAVLKEAGYWKEGSIVEDADLSCKIYCMGYRGVYLSDVRIYSEDPASLEVWKKQAARVAQGWARCALANGRMILTSKKLSIWRRIVLFSTLIGPFQGLSWVIVTFISALGLMLGLTAPSNSIFSSPIYIILVTVPVVVFYGSCVYALRIQKIMNTRNLVLLPLLSYTTSCMTAAIMIGFLNGMRGRIGFFFRTPKYGEKREEKDQYDREISLDKNAIIEGVLASVALAMSVVVLLYGVWTLALTLGAFGALTLKSMNLSRIFSHNGPVSLARSSSSQTGTEFTPATQAGRD